MNLPNLSPRNKNQKQQPKEWMEISSDVVDSDSYHEVDSGRHLSFWVKAKTVPVSQTWES
jgi:hypothetical protein